MGLVLFYSLLLISGIIVSQSINLCGINGCLRFLTNLCLAYIMMEVGREFVVDKSKLASYGKDFIFAFLAAALPWVLCAIYFIAVLHAGWKESFLVGIFSAPTSAGVLFAMLAAAGLGTTWVFKKAQVLAVFDDFVALLLLIPLQIVFIGIKPELFAVVLTMIVLLAAAFHWLHQWRIPAGQYWLIFYSLLVVLASAAVHEFSGMELGVLLPAFALGSVLYNPHLSGGSDRSYDKKHQEPRRGTVVWLDRLIKGLFMFLVGCALPKMQVQGINIGVFALHVLALTVLSNLGKCFLFFCYRKEADWHKRLALSVAMFPRGEVGAGVLLVAIGYGVGGAVVSLSILSLALNLVLTGFFIAVVMALLKPAGTVRVS